MTTLYDAVCRIRAEIAEYITAGMSEEQATDYVHENSCTGWKVWQIVHEDIQCEICGSRIDVSKSSKLYCTAICWKNPEYDHERALQKAEAEAATESHHGAWGDRN